MPELRLQRLTRQFRSGGDHLVGLKDVELVAPDAQIQVWLGPSGSGKSTGLRMISGIDPPDRGRVLLGNEDLSGIPTYERAISKRIYHVFQSASLYPHLTIRRNLEFGLTEWNISTDEFSRRLEAGIAVLFPDLNEAARVESFLEKRANQISGGERQRVNLLKALVRQPRVLLLDEPLSSVDAQLRVDIRRALRTWQQQHRITCIWVTHDQHEATAVADSIAVFNSGRLLQVGNPTDLFEQPTHREVAVFICAGLGAPMSLLRAHLTLDVGFPVLRLGVNSVPLAFEGDAADITDGQDVDVGFRANAFALLGQEEPGAIVATVTTVERDAEGKTLVCRCNGGNLVVHQRGNADFSPGDTIWCRPSGQLMLFAVKDGRRLSPCWIRDGASSLKGL